MNKKINTAYMHSYIGNVFRVEILSKLIAKQINRLTELPKNCYLVWVA